jgi:hypothetical protein
MGAENHQMTEAKDIESISELSRSKAEAARKPKGRTEAIS